MHIELPQFDRQASSGHEIPVVVQDDKTVVRGGGTDLQIDGGQRLMLTPLGGPQLQAAERGE
ncbi:hypothetical protein, partial [Streptomyces griseiscabiei]|uniref:hypothetical protein n=1 Tax=Streptomyces griseiscabiei TaxID=2993540 RepID=UPI0015C50BE5